jgi:hypothetical protein
MSNYFYGWYFRCQGKDGSVAVIPAVHLSAEKCSCSIQVVTQKGSFYREFPISQFRINRKKGIMQIEENLFSGKGICLRLEAILSEETSDDGYGPEGRASDERKVMISGILRFGEFSKPKYDIMGPFAYLSRMECRHAVYSMRHTVNGKLKFSGETINFQDGTGYMEGDSGTSFPDKYIWTQHFLKDGSIMVAAATIPLAGMHFTGTIGFVFKGKREYRFATHLGASVTRMGNKELVIRQGSYRLHVRFLESGGNVLKAPEGGRMTRRIKEDISCKVEYTLLYRNQVLLHTVTDKAAAERDVKEISRVTSLF